MKNIKSIYISDEDEKTWKLIEKKALKENFGKSELKGRGRMGIGRLLMEAWRKVSEVKK